MKIRGIIYKYKSPSNKIYIGQTINEQRRRNTFFNLNLSYGGKKIDNARKKYLPENFEYEIVTEKYFDSLEDAKVNLDNLEIYYIDYFNSYNEGYNSTLGGGTTTGYKASEETKLLHSIQRKGIKFSDEHCNKISESLKGKKKSEQHIKQLSEQHKKPLDVYSKQDELLMHFDSVVDAANYYNTQAKYISAVLTGHRKSHRGVIFKYAC